MNDAPRRRIASRAARLVIALLLPFVLVLTNVRLLLTPLFVSVEYSTPGFPTDRYGFSQADRVRWAQLARLYLLNDAGPEFLSQLRDDGGMPLYNPRELRHMVDVKTLVQGAIKVWLLLAIVLAAAGVLAWRLGDPGTARGGLRLGARLTLITMAALVALLLVSFSSLFTGFHEIFFVGGTWIFYYSDTLIRLFPLRFWRDAFALLMILTVVEAAILWWATRTAVEGTEEEGPGPAG